MEQIPSPDEASSVVVLPPSKTPIQNARRKVILGVLLVFGIITALWFAGGIAIFQFFFQCFYNTISFSYNVSGIVSTICDLGVAAVIVFWPKHQEHAERRYATTILYICGIAFLFRLILSPFFVWRDTVVADKKTQDDLTGRTEKAEIDRDAYMRIIQSHGPNLKAEINSLLIGRYTQSKDVLIEIQMQVLNSGDAPSLIRSFSMQIIGADKQIFYPFVAASFIHSSLPLSTLPTYNMPYAPPLPSTQEGEQSVMDDNLIKKGMNPIPSGGMMEGFLVFVLPNSTLDYLGQKGTVFNVTFCDVKDKIITVTRTNAEVSNSPILSIPVIPSTPPSPTPDKSGTLPKPTLSMYP